MAEYAFPKTLPYVYCGLAEASYKPDPITFLKENYKTNIHKDIELKERSASDGWDFMLFHDKKNNSLIVAFRGTDISEMPTDVLYDLYNELGDPTMKPMIIEMSQTVSKWLNKYNQNNQYDQVTFVGHSEGGLFARYVLHNDKRIHCRITFNTAKPWGFYNFRSKDDPITLISGFVMRQAEIWIHRRLPDQVWTICFGGHGIRNFAANGVLIDENDKRKTWHDVKKLEQEFKQKWIGDGHIAETVQRWFEEGNIKERTKNFWWRESTRNKHYYKLGIITFVAITSVYIAMKQQS